MKYRKLGNTDLKVSAVGIGTYQFGGAWGKDFNENEVREILDEAMNCGINFIDTAECYGVNHLSERLIGPAIKGSRDKWIIASKFGHIRVDTLKGKGDWSVEGIQKQLERSLSALKTDYIDIYQFHSGSNEAFDNDELWTMLHKQVEAGKLRYLGLSMSRSNPEWVAHQTENASKAGAKVIQIKYNRLEQDANEEYFSFCKKENIGLVARVPLASGLLSGKYQDLTEFDSSESRAKKYDAVKIKKLQAEIAEILATEVPAGVSLAEYALAWILSNDAISSVIPGCKSPAQVRSNAAGADVNLTGNKHPLEI